MRTLHPTSLLLVTFSLLFAGCGGSGPQQVTVVLGGVAALDGQTNSSGSAISTAALVIGDFSSNASTRGHLGFDLSPIPKNAEVLAATLEAFQVSVTGTPYADLGNIVVDHVDIGPGLDPSDHASPALLAAFGVFSASPALGSKTIDVTARVEADRSAGRTTSSYRLRFATDTDGDGTQEFVLVNDTENNSGPPTQRPRLVVTYLN